MSEAADYSGGDHRLPATVMSGERTAEGQQTGDDKGHREQSLGAPSLGDDARGYLRAGVAPEEGTEDHVFDRFAPVKLLRQERDSLRLESEQKAILIIIRTSKSGLALFALVIASRVTEVVTRTA